MKINYNSNNSGGSWWLKDEDWTALEKAGWEVEWKKDQTNEFSKPDKNGRWLGALATTASKEFETPKEGILEFEKVTGQDASDEGCNHCGAPHSFSWGEDEDYGYASGDDVIGVLYANVPGSLREVAEMLNQ